MGDILFLAHRIPFPPDRGDKIRAHHLLKHLAGLAPVHVGCFAESKKDLAAETQLAAVAESHVLVERNKPLLLAGAEAVVAGKPVSLTAFHSHKLARWVRQTIAQHEIGTIFVFSGQMGQYIPDDFAGTVVIDLCDVDSAKFEDYAAAGERVWLNRREAGLLAREEERLARRADTTILISDNEAALLSSRLQDPSGTHICAIGNGIDAESFRPDAVKPQEDIADRPGPHLIFTGQMDYRPNEAAAIWAIEELLPEVRRIFPSAEFHVVGRNPTAVLQGHAGASGVTIWGEVPDVRPFLAAADVSLVPLSIARGVQNKVLEAMAMALPIVLTSEAATGITARNGDHWIIEEADPIGMAKRVKALWESEALRLTMGAAARNFVLTNHAWDAMLAPLGRIVANEKRVRHAA